MSFHSMKLVFCSCSVRYSVNIAHEVILILFRTHISPQQSAPARYCVLVYLYTINMWLLLGCVWLIIFQDKNYASMQKLCFRSLLPWFLDHVNSTYLKIFYFKLLLDICMAGMPKWVISRVYSIYSYSG